jgi:AraC-like DNA-binding protein
MKPRAFSRLLTAQETNLTTIINRLKQEYAEDELAHSDSSVANIATDLGYSDPTSFARSFNKWTNMSPREFRQSSA